MYPKINVGTSVTTIYLYRNLVSTKFMRLFCMTIRSLWFYLSGNIHKHSSMYAPHATTGVYTHAFLESNMHVETTQCCVQRIRHASSGETFCPHTQLAPKSPEIYQNASWCISPPTPQVPWPLPGFQNLNPCGCLDVVPFRLHASSSVGTVS